jgi:hypothetical protein
MFTDKRRYNLFPAREHVVNKRAAALFAVTLIVAVVLDFIAAKAFATTVVAIGMPDGIVIAADSKGVYTTGAHGGPICKIMPIGLAFIAVLGLAWDVDYGFSVPATARQAYTSDGTFVAWVAGTEKLMKEIVSPQSLKH